MSAASGPRQAGSSLQALWWATLGTGLGSLPDSAITVNVIQLQPEPPLTQARAASGDWLLKGDHQPLVWLLKLGDQFLQVREDLLLNAFHGLQRHKRDTLVTVQLCVTCDTPSAAPAGKPKTNGLVQAPGSATSCSEACLSDTRDPATRGEEGDHVGPSWAVPVDTPEPGVVDCWQEGQMYGFHARELRVQGRRGRGG
ncbi:hypothetical protein PAL_GLEAN10017915 [Pteropus alecto]|uniref:Uncharacterized protein n=1 Tax=Pteropus alecto TaxID=9402 RepID=L5KZW7_PTEAL|nr:hypothetical protein PAL_GLEAN10017915 [Pteropus alecto]